MTTNALRMAGYFALLILAGILLYIQVPLLGSPATTANASSLAPVKTDQAQPVSMIEGCDPNWNVVPSPNEGTSHNELWAVDAVSGSDVWAVGNYLASGVARTL